MKITSGNIADIIGALPVGKYAGYYSSGVTGTPSSYGTFEAIVMNDSTATITAIDTSNGTNYIRVKTSNAWKDWERDVTNSDLINSGAKTVIHRTNAGGSWGYTPAAIRLDTERGKDTATCLASMTTKSGVVRIMSHASHEAIVFRFMNSDNTESAVFNINAANKTAYWE